MQLRNVRDLHLKIADNLKDGEIEIFDKAVNLKNEKGYWKIKLEEKLRQKLGQNFDEIENCIEEKLNENVLKVNWKKLYIDCSKFIDFYHLSLIITFLKDYYSNDYSLYYLSVNRKTIKSEGFFDLLDYILDFLNGVNLQSESLGPFESYLMINRRILEKIQENYNKIQYDFPFDIINHPYIDRFKKFQNDFSSFIFSIIIKRKPIYKSIEIDLKGIITILDESFIVKFK